MKRKFGMADKLGYMFGDFGNDFAFTVIFLLRQVTGYIIVYVFVKILYGCDGRIGGSRWYDDDGSAAA